MDLKKDIVEYCDLLELLEHHDIEIVLETKDSIVIYYPKMKTYFIACENKDEIDSVVKAVDYEKAENISSHSLEVALALKNIKYSFEVYNGIYKGEKAEVKTIPDVEIRPLGMEYADFVHERYKSVDSLEYIQERIEEKMLWGAFKNNEMLGFIGCHDEGSIGLLEVFQPYRRMGIGSLLGSFMVNERIKNKHLPFSQVVVTNEASIKYHHALGMKLGKQKITWCEL